MHAIIPTITPGDSGAAVANLQDAILALVEHHVIKALDAAQRPTISELVELTKALQYDRAHSLYGASLWKLVTFFQMQHGLGDHLRGVVESATAEKINELLRSVSVLDPRAEKQFVVRGKVHGAKRGQYVRAYDVDFRKPAELLGQSTINENLEYVIPYSAADFQRAERGTADVRVVVREAGGRELGSSDIHYNVATDVTIDLVVGTPDASSEYERYMAELELVLQGVSLGEVDGEPENQKKTDLDFLAGDTGIERQHIAWLARAEAFESRVLQAYAKRTRDAQNGHVAIPAAVFYGWFREGQPDEWDALVAQPISALRTALVATIDDNVIPRSFAGQIESVLHAIPNPKRDAVRNVGTLVELPPETVAKLLTRVSDVPELSNALVSRLVTDKVLNSGEARSLGLGVTLHNLLDGRLDAVAALRDARPAGINGGAVQRVNDLAALDVADVRAALERANVQPPEGLTLDTVADRVVRSVATAFPTDFLLHRVTDPRTSLVETVAQLYASPRTSEDAVEASPELSRTSDRPIRELVNQFPGLGLSSLLERGADARNAVALAEERIGWLRDVHTNNPDLDLLAIDYLPESESLNKVNFGDLGEPERKMVVSTLKGYQRVQALTGDAITSLALLKAGHHSSSSILRSTVDDFAATTRLPLPLAAAVYAQADQQANNAAISLFGILDLARGQGRLPPALAPEVPAALARLSGYADLFGALSSCECEHCQSMLSPSAYFVDLMWFVETQVLNDTFKAHGGENNELHLKRRRKDLWTLKLTCENTEQYLPYLTIVIRVLEEYIARKVPAAANGLYELLAATDSSIRQPFTLPLERLTTLLSHFEIGRYDIAQHYVLDATPGAIGIRVRCRLGISAKEYDIITNGRLGSPMTPASLLAAGNYFEQLVGGPMTFTTIVANVETQDAGALSVFLLAQAVGLEREIALLVFASDFVNGAATPIAQRITIERGISNPGAVQNDTELVRQLRIGRMDRIERFVRLWRHVPWNVVELDYVLTRLDFRIPSAGVSVPGRLDPTIMGALVLLLDLHERWSLPVDELCALWDDIPTTGLRNDASLFDRMFNQPLFVKSPQDRLPLPTTRFAFPEISLAPNAPNMHARLLAALQITDAELVQLMAGLDPRNVGLWLTKDNLSQLHRHARLSRLLGISIAELFQTVELVPAAGTAITSLDALQSVLKLHAWRTVSGFALDEVRFIVGKSATLDQYPSPVQMVAELAASVATDTPLELSDIAFAQVGLSDTDSRSVIAANLSAAANDGLPLERVPGQPTYRLRAAWDPDDATAPFVFAPVATSAMIADAARAAYDLASTFGLNGFDQQALQALGFTTAQAAAFVAANLHAGADTKPFESIAASSRVRVRTDITPAAAIQSILADNASRTLLEMSQTAELKTRAHELLARHHPLRIIVMRVAAALLTDAARLRAMLELVKPSDITEVEQFTAALCLGLRGGSQQPLVQLLGMLTRLRVLFKDGAFDAQALGLVQNARNIFGLPVRSATRLTTLVLDTENVRRAAMYASLARKPDSAFDSAALAPDVGALQAALVATSLPAADADMLARALVADRARIAAMLRQLGGQLSAGLDGLSQLRDALVFAGSLGASAETLKLAVSDVFADLTRAADGVQGLFRAKYPDDAVFHDKLEPFEDTLRGRQRTGLVEFLLHPPVTAPDILGKFRSPNDLYDYFLIDAMLEGCARTSELVAAISSVQLYVHRVLMHLERSDDGPIEAVLPTAAREEWKWRKNYRVWEANRRIFLFPENYVEPGLRDDKTPLFKELEDTLLQKQISEQNVLDAYAEYLHGFDEIARLKIAGAYHDGVGTGNDVLHLFGVTSSDPPVYYYRTIKSLESNGKASFGSWKQINLQIPVRKVSPVVLGGRLFVFWTEFTTRPLNNFKDGSNQFAGYRHTVRIKFSQLRLDGRWTAPQTLRVPDKDGLFIDSRVVDDKLIKIHIQVLNNDGGVMAGPFDVATITIDQFRVLFVAAAQTDENGGHYRIVFTYRAEWDEKKREHAEPIENYFPAGWLWERVYPSADGTSLRLGALPNAPSGAVTPTPMLVDFWNARAQSGVASTVKAYHEPIVVAPGQNPSQDDSTVRIMYAQRDTDSGLPFYYASRYLNDRTVFSGTGLISASGPLFRVPTGGEFQAVNGSSGGIVVEASGETLLFQTARATLPPDLRRLGSTLVPKLGEQLMRERLAGLLKTDWQELSLTEPDLAVTGIDASVDATTHVSNDPIGKGSPLAGYYREVFFQVPFLVADYLNSQQDFEGSQRWYHYLFDPTATDKPATSDKVRPWRYVEFRNIAKKTHSYDTVREMLTDSDQLAAYHQDPFNPHAIARLRPAAYQKAIVMKYIDNLIDWGDSLFSQFTMESLNEATMLYVMAADILGRRPVTAGPCSDSVSETRTYESLAPRLREPGDHEFLMEDLELLGNKSSGTSVLQPKYIAVMPGDHVFTPVVANDLVGAVAGYDPSGFSGGAPNPMGWSQQGADIWTSTKGTPISALDATGTPEGSLPFTVVGTGAGMSGVLGDPLDPPNPTIPAIGGIGGVGPTVRDLQHGGKATALDPTFGHDIPLRDLPPQREYTPPPKPWDLLKARLAFCVPENRDLLAYWDRVDDRLYKIRNCQDIAGVRRRLELFAPEIDPRMLVRLRAAGLSLDDVLNATSGTVPPYRFQYLIEKAKQHAGLVQSFGNQLLGALEKRDAEELTRLRTVHEQNLLKMRSKTMQLEIKAAEESLESLRRQKTAGEYRRDHFAALLRTGLSDYERVQQVGTHIASGLHGIEATVQIMSGILSLIPQLGAPTAIVYGGIQLGGAGAAMAHFNQATAQAARAAADSSGLEGGHQRRNEDWLHQIELAKHDLQQIEKQITTAEFRRDIATQAFEMHERSIDQAQEIFEFLRDRFTNFGRYTFLSTELQKLNRLSFNAALSMARLAERAYRFERPDEGSTTVLTDSYWDAGNAGLLAGDRLMLDLQQLERRFLETNHRTLEVEQSFSLARLDPGALLKLREKGTCTLSIPELAFDLAYPGQYRRRIKTVRLSIPCVTGPYLNVGATLRLTSSRVRQRANLTDALTDVPLGHTSTISTSSAQNDAGVFEFSFRDERFMPFEGAGAISEWQLDLPTSFREFDYRTISDAVLRIAYTAEESSVLATAAQDLTSTAAASLRKTLGTQGMPLLFSLRYDFPDAWRMLVTAPVGTSVPIELRETHLPAIMANWLHRGVSSAQLSMSPSELHLVTDGTMAGAKPDGTFAVGVGTTSTLTPVAVSAAKASDGLYLVPVSGTATFGSGNASATIRVVLGAAGNLGPTGTNTNGVTIDEAKLRDLLLLARVTIGA
ncbi:MAG: hypothetical protein JWL61_3035 [Gemmatimonadetes bacterium]|nr:hypothetical protein [Gemmatimonadota bacterium]